MRSWDLKRVGLLPYCEYDPKVYNCAYIKSPDMYAKVSVFPSGKMISAGTTDTKRANHDLNAVVRYLRKSRLVGNVRTAVAVRNLVGLFDLGQPIDIKAIVSDFSHIIYEPEQFPGAIFRPLSTPGVTILLFASGKCVIAGARDQYRLHTAVAESLSVTHCALLMTISMAEMFLGFPPSFTTVSVSMRMLLILKCHAPSLIVTT